MGSARRSRLRNPIPLWLVEQSRCAYISFKDSLAFLFRRLPIADGITEEADDKCAYNCDRDHGFGSSLFVSLLMVLCVIESISRFPRPTFQKSSICSL